MHNVLASMTMSEIASRVTPEEPHRLQRSISRTHKCVIKNCSIRIITRHFNLRTTRLGTAKTEYRLNLKTGRLGTTPSRRQHHRRSRPQLQPPDKTQLDIVPVLPIACRVTGCLQQRLKSNPIVRRSQKSLAVLVQEFAVAVQTYNGANVVKPRYTRIITWQCPCQRCGLYTLTVAKETAQCKQRRRSFLTKTHGMAQPVQQDNETNE